jgi:hypothetical protein
MIIVSYKMIIFRRGKMNQDREVNFLRNAILIIRKKLFYHLNKSSLKFDLYIYIYFI